MEHSAMQCNTMTDVLRLCPVVRLQQALSAVTNVSAFYTLVLCWYILECQWRRCIYGRCRRHLVWI